MRMKFLAMAGIAAAFLFTPPALQESAAANMSPAQVGKIESNRIVEPTHCRARRHYHTRCSNGRCVRYWHRCG